MKTADIQKDTDCNDAYSDKYASLNKNLYFKNSIFYVHGLNLSIDQF